MPDNQTTEINELEQLNLSVRARNSLRFSEITTVEQIRVIGHRGLLDLPTLGRKAANEVWSAVQGIILDGEVVPNG